MVPLRFINDVMGAETGWDEETRTVTITPADGAEITIVIGQELPGGLGTADIVAGRTFVPVRYVANELGAVTDWDNATRTVTIIVGDGGPDVPVAPPVEPPVVTPPAAPAENAPEYSAPTGENTPGIIVQHVTEGDAETGVQVIIGQGQDVWPFALANEDDGGRAFEPVPGETYRLVFNVTATGTEGWRVRWGTGFGAWNDFTPADLAIVNDHDREPGQIATVIPARFVEGFTSDGTYTLVVDITLDGSQPFNGLIGNISLVGMFGSHDFIVNWVIVEHNGETIAQWSA
jgi:hypothetical protein